MQPISIIVPTLNEENNISPLIYTIDDVMRQYNISYEVIFVDDKSTDSTQKNITNLLQFFPITFHLKKGKKGKAQSLIEGFTYAKYDIVCMVDADLQYPPSAIPLMLNKILQGADIVIANRNEIHTSIHRKVISRAFRFVFGRILHGFDYDVQSGLKMFRKEVTERLTLNPSPWTIDMELLLKARDAGYTITTVDISFSKRKEGKAKINLFRASYEIGIHALKLKLSKPAIIPLHKLEMQSKGEGFHYKGQKFIHYSSLTNKESAFFRLTTIQALFLMDVLLFFILCISFDARKTLIFFLATLTFFYFMDLLFNVFLIFRSLHKQAGIYISNQELENANDALLPNYTIFCPLYKEWRVIPQFVKAMEQLNYPKEKLQIMFLLEENDVETIEKVQEFNLPKTFEVIIVPHSQPKTKPKALNYGLRFATGEYIVVYDAEDVPDTLQLKKAIIAFRKSNENIACIQAKLNFYNPNHNLLTKMFSAEYALWFDLILPGLQSLKAPIPLGGTSNHFKTDTIKKLKGWDAFNVTEDCDLGIRLAKKGYLTAIIDSVTLEEANSDFFNWMNQRSRWIKGYIQTYFVHMRNPYEFLSDFRNPRIAIFQLIVGGKILSMFINPLMWLITIAYFAFRPIIGPTIESFYPAPVLYMGVACLIFGNFLYLYYYMIGCAKHGHDQLIKYTFLVPVYWLMMSFAAIKGVDSIIRNPHYWAKTNHGLHLTKESTEISKKINRSWIPYFPVLGKTKGGFYEKNT